MYALYTKRLFHVHVRSNTPRALSTTIMTNMVRNSKRYFNSEVELTPHPTLCHAILGSRGTRVRTSISGLVRDIAPLPYNMQRQLKAILSCSSPPPHARTLKPCLTLSRTISLLVKLWRGLIRGLHHIPAVGAVPCLITSKLKQ